MAGAGYKLFNTGDVLTAAQVNTYLQEQAVMRFANAAARTTALSGVLAEGMVSYLDDTNQLEVYDGSAWTSASGDITAVTAGTGISGGGTSGAVTITNSMATAIDAKGDLIVGTGADTFSRLAVSATDGHVLKVKASTSTGLEWGASSGGYGNFISFTPTFTGITVGNGTLTGEYRSDEETTQVLVKLIFGSTTSVTGSTTMTLPVTAATNPREPISISGKLQSTGAIDSVPWIQIASTTTCNILWFNTANANSYATSTPLASTSPWTWKNTDQIILFFTYEKA